MSINSVVKRSWRSAVGRLTDFKRRTKMRKAKRHIFVDCGANTCTVLRGFIRKFPTFEFWAFEAQPELAREGAALMSEFPDTQITFFSKAVWIKNETLDFYLATEWKNNYKGGSTLKADHTANKSKVDYGNPIQVAAIDFSEWLRDNFSEEDYVIVKMDIEGAEYDVLEKVIADNNHLIIDELIIEFHHHMSDAVSKERHDALVKKIKSFARLQIWH